VPTPPDAPMISTRCPASTPPLATIRSANTERRSKRYC
jgi:hypothetical protein